MADFVSALPPAVTALGACSGFRFAGSRFKVSALPPATVVSGLVKLMAAALEISGWSSAVSFR
jgi:hypothetical protein